MNHENVNQGLSSLNKPAYQNLEMCVWFNVKGRNRQIPQTGIENINIDISFWPLNSDKSCIFVKD